MIANHNKKRKKKEANQTTTKIFYRGKLTAQNPSIFYYIFTKESWNNYNALFSQESPALSQLSHTNPDKIDQHLANFQPLLSLPCLRNSSGMQSQFFRKFNFPKLHINAHGPSHGCLTACGKPTNNINDS